MGKFKKRKDWIWKLCNMAFGCGVVPKDWRSAMIVPLYIGEQERTECKNYRGISLLSMVKKCMQGCSESID